MEFTVTVTVKKVEGRKQDPYDIAVGLEEALDGVVSEFYVEDINEHESTYEVEDITVVKPTL